MLPELQCVSATRMKAVVGHLRDLWDLGRPAKRTKLRRGVYPNQISCAIQVSSAADVACVLPLLFSCDSPACCHSVRLRQWPCCCRWLP